MLEYGRLDSGGNILTPLGEFSPSLYGDSHDAVQLPNGNIVFAWNSYNGSKYEMNYTVFSPTFSVVKAATKLASLSRVGDDNISVAGAGNMAVLTWGDACCSYMPNLYYVLVDSAGSLLTPPTIFHADNDNYYVETVSNGQGNTWLPWNYSRPVSQAASPRYSTGPFEVSWGGSASQTSITGYKIWVKDGPGGMWTEWLEDTQATHATFSLGLPGHTYYFRSQARAANGMSESPLPEDGDCLTTIAAVDLSGKIQNLRGEPVFGASVQSQPQALAPQFTSQGDGSYHVYLSSTGSYELTIGRQDYGILPPAKNIQATSSLSGLDYVLPPVTDGVVNGGFESGDLTGWQTGAVAATLSSSAAHTGYEGLDVSFTNTITQPEAVITQSLVVSDEWENPALSWMYKVPQSIGGIQLEVRVSSISTTITQSIPLASGAWQHAWLDLGAFEGQSVSIGFYLRPSSLKEPTVPLDVYLDEISAGPSLIGSYPQYLPLTKK